LRVDYDEEDDGFLFTRAKARKMRTSTGRSVEQQQELPLNNRSLSNAEPIVQVAIQNGDQPDPLKNRRKKMSFSTPNIRDEKPLRRSKRLSDEHEQPNGSPQHKARRKEPSRVENQEVDKRRIEDQAARQTNTPSAGPLRVPEDEHSATKIALPFADTPVIRRNKAMREGRAGKGERRSSLGLRGRRASSLIDTGTSNAVPHSEVDIADFYKHIESDGLPEPRRMRQLLTWCATRAMDEKPTGTEFEDQSARMAGKQLQFLLWCKVAS
jgi:kinetochore protein Mis13/DSN1